MFSPDIGVVSPLQNMSCPLSATWRYRLRLELLPPLGVVPLSPGCDVYTRMRAYHHLSRIFVSQGLKTGMYYLRTKAAAQAIQFTVDRTKLSQNQKTTAAVEQEDATSSVESQQPAREDHEAAVIACSLENKEACLMCSG